MVSRPEPPDARADEPQERRRILGIVEEIGQIERQDRKVVRRVHGRVHIPEKPLVVVQQSLPQRGIRRKVVARMVSRSTTTTTHKQRGLRRSVDIIALVEFALQIGQPDHDGEVLPHVDRPQLQRFADGARRANLRAGDLPIFGPQHSFPLERVEVLREGAAERAQVVSFDDE